MVSTTESSRVWAEVVEHDARFEFPDVIGYADGGPDGASWRAGPWVECGRVHRPAAMPKAGGGVRLLSVLDPAVHARYRSLVGRVADAVERALGPEVAAGRCLTRPRGLAVESWRPAWRRHARRVCRLAREAGPVLHMDVRDCFGSLDAEVIVELLRAVAPRDDVRELSALLARFRSDGIRGLPVGPEPSAVLANVALAIGDRALRSLGVPFARWCDDVAVGLRGRDPSEAAEAWAAAIRPLGLMPALEKSRVVDSTAAGDVSMSVRLNESSVLTPAADLRRRHRPRRAAGADHATAGADRSALLELAVTAPDEPDPHVARALVAAAALNGGRAARRALRHVRRRAPYLCSTIDWGLHR